MGRRGGQLKFVKFAYPLSGEAIYVNLEYLKEVTTHRGEVTTVHLSYVGGSRRVLTGECAEDFAALLDKEVIEL